MFTFLEAAFVSIRAFSPQNIKIFNQTQTSEW